MTVFSSIDETLSAWAKKHSLNWLAEYRDSDVRTFFLNTDSPEKVQIWIDPPHGGLIVVHVVQYKLGGKRKHSEEIASDVTGLPNALDCALRFANEWLAK